MSNTKTTRKVFISYSHDSETHKQAVRKLADTLISDYGIDVVVDCYEEDNPTGGLLTNFMQNIREADRIVCVLTPAYKVKADEGKGGVSYESVIITDELYKDIGSSKVIPIVIDPTLPLDYCTPNFLTSTRKAILRKNYDKEELFIEELARVIHQMPEKPKPSLGKNKLLSQSNDIQNVQDIDIQTLTGDCKRLFDSALFYAKTGDIKNFQLLFRKTKELVFMKLDLRRKENESSFQAKNNGDLTLIMDEFMDDAAPLLLIAFAGYLSANEKFYNQEGLLIDLLLADGGWSKGGFHYVAIQEVPKLLAYVYHHMYGALNINDNQVGQIVKIFQQKIPVEPPSKQYKYLYEVPAVTAFISSLGRNCFKSFDYLLTAYQRWDWIGLLFQNEQEFRKALVSYQMVINLLSYFHMVKNKMFPLERDDIVSYPIIPPAFLIAEPEILQNSYHFMIKHTEFFKKHLAKIDLSETEALERWTDFLNLLSHYYNSQGVYHRCAYDNDFMENLLK